MRLRQMQQIIRSYLPENVAVDGVLLPNGQHGTRIHNLNRWREALQRLSTVPPLRGYTAPLLDNQAFMTAYGDRLMGTHGELQPVVGLLQKLHEQASELLEMLELALPEQDEQRTLVIEIPQPESMKSLAELVADIDRFFELLARAESDEPEVRIGNPSVQAFDSGSYYIEVLVASAFGLPLVGKVIGAAFNILKHYQELRRNAAYTETLELAVEERKSIKETNEILRRAMAQSLVTSLRDNHFPKARKEAFNALLAAVQEGTKLLQSGVNVLPPITAQGDIEKYFPSPDEVRALVAPDAQKMLAQNAETPSSDTEAPSKKTPEK